MWGKKGLSVVSVYIRRTSWLIFMFSVLPKQSVKLMLCKKPLQQTQTL